MTRIVHISDTHFGTEVPEVVAAIQKAMRQLQPDIVILSGDITQRARRSQFRSAAQFMEALPATTKLVIPGNHDIPLFNLLARLLAPYTNYRRAFGPRERVWTGQGIAVVCYDSTAPQRHTRGKLSARVLMRGLAALGRPEADGIIIACAHQPLVTAWPQDAHETLIGRDQTAQIWSQQRVDMVLSGHVHVPIATTTESAFPNLSFSFILAGAGTAVSRRIRPGAPNSFNVIDIVKQESGPAVDITLHYFQESQKQFLESTAVRFIRTAQGWRKTVVD